VSRDIRFVTRLVMVITVVRVVRAIIAVTLVRIFRFSSLVLYFLESLML
jgi:hypothetical protein